MLSLVAKHMDIINMYGFLSTLQEEESCRGNFGHLTEKTGSINKENEDLSLSERDRERDTSWQKFGAEYNEFGELISCGKEPLGKKDGFLLDYEKRDRSKAFWQVGEEYEGLVDGYGNRIDSIGINRGRWDNVQRGPLLYTSQNPDFVPDRSHPSNTGRRRF